MKFHKLAILITKLKHILKLKIIIQSQSDLKSVRFEPSKDYM